MTHFEKVKSFLQDMEVEIVSEDSEEELVVVELEEAGIKNMVIDCEDPILVIEQFLFDVKAENAEMFKKLLVKNREIVHGAFCLNEEGTKVLFRDTLQLENLDYNELEASINALTLLLGEYYRELLGFATA